jgi:hypothetical protein
MLACVQRASFYFAHPELFLIPVEHLSPSGMSETFNAELDRRSLVSKSFRDLFDEGFRRLFEALSRLAARAPDAFPPPRLVNVAVLLDPGRIHPYFQPFEGMTNVAYAADFDPATSSVEHAAFQLLFAERLGQTRRASLAAMAALPYLFQLDEPRLRDFIEGARRSIRPDAESARAVADILPELRANAACEGVDFEGSPPEGYGRVKSTPLAFRRDFLATLQGFVKRLDGIAHSVVEAYYEAERARRPRRDPEEEVCRFLHEARPRVLVVSKSGGLLWEPSLPEATADVREAIAGIGERPAQSLIADLRTVSDVTARFLEGVKGAADFRVPTQSIEESGGVYVHHDRKLLAYALEQPGLQPLREEAPPYHRLLLAARAMHEWGHLSVEAGVVRVPPERRADLEAARGEVRACFERIVSRTSPEARPLLEEEVRALLDEGTDFASLPFARIEDYGANLIVCRLLPPEVFEAYARANVRSLAAEDIGLLRKLARYAYEVQYLRLVGLEDPWGYLAASTYFKEEFVDAGVVSEEDAKALIAAVAKVCACHEVDEGRINEPPAG